MKLRFIVLFIAFTVVAQAALARKSELHESTYFIFQSNQKLNAHLFLYNKALVCKFSKTPNDSLVHYAFKDNIGNFSTADQQALNKVIRFYRDSLLARDLLFDSLMRNFSDYLGMGYSSKNKPKNYLQLLTLQTLKVFQPYFQKLYWPAIDSANKLWLDANKAQILALEDKIVPELERIYKTKLPAEKIRVDLTCYATWAGAYSYHDSFCHVIFSSVYKSNQGDLAAEVIFHETSHFLVDKLSEQIMLTAKNKDVKKDLNLWHHIIFYTTGYLMEKEYKLKWQKFEPYYLQQKFPDRFPDFKTTVEGCKLYWDPYMEGSQDFETSIKALVNHQLVGQ